MNTAPTHALPPGDSENRGDGRFNLKPGFNQKVLPFLLLTIITLATYSGALRNGFVLDDRPFIVDNPVFLKLQNLPLIFHSDDAVGTGSHNPYYRPLTTLTFAVDRIIFGRSPVGYHATNVLLHLAVTLLLYLLVMRISPRPATAFLAALFFAVHPAHAEPVAYISARADLMCGLGLTASLLLHLRWRETGSRVDLAFSVAAFAVAAFSKIVALAFPALLAFHVVFLGREKRRWMAAILPYVAVAAAFLVVRENVLEMKSWEGNSPFEIHFSNTGVFLVKYLRNALFPFGLRLFYDLPIRLSFFEPIVLSAWSILAAITYFAVATVRRHPAAIFGTAWFFACLLPVSGLFEILDPPMADRYLYVPLIGLVLASTSLFDRFHDETICLRARSPLAGVILILAAGMAVTTASRVAAWRDPLTYWSSAAADNPGSIHVQVGLGCAFRDVGRLDEAEKALGQAIRIRDTRPEIQVYLAEILLDRGDYSGAEGHLCRALEMNPTDSRTLSLLGIVFAETGRLADARNFWVAALGQNPFERIALAALAKDAGSGTPD